MDASRSVSSFAELSVPTAIQAHYLFVVAKKRRASPTYRQLPFGALQVKKHGAAPKPGDYLVLTCKLASSIEQFVQTFVTRLACVPSTALDCIDGLRVGHIPEAY